MRAEPENAALSWQTRGDLHHSAAHRVGVVPVVSSTCTMRTATILTRTLRIFLHAFSSPSRFMSSMHPWDGI